MEGSPLIGHPLATLLGPLLLLALPDLGDGHHLDEVAHCVLPLRGPCGLAPLPGCKKDDIF